MSTSMSQVFGTASRTLRAKRRTLSNELTAFLLSAISSTPPTISEFQEKQLYFGKCWEEVVTLTYGCIKLISDDEDIDGEEKATLQETLDDLRFKMDNLKIMESDYARKAFSLEDVKNVEVNIGEDVSTDKTESPVVEENELSDVSTSNVDHSIADSAVEKTENLNVESNAESLECGESDSEIKQEVLETKSDVSLIETISQLFKVQTQEMNVQTQSLREDMSGNMIALHESNESLNRCVNKLSDNMDTKHKSVNEIRNNVIDLREENVGIKRDLETSVVDSEKK